MTEDPSLPPGAFNKEDAGDDLAFYAPPRLVPHIDEGAIAALTGYLERAGFGQVEAHVLADGSLGDPLVTVIGYA